MDYKALQKRSKKTEKQEAVLPPAPVTDQPITETIETNYMPYVMSVIVMSATCASKSFDWHLPNPKFRRQSFISTSMPQRTWYASFSNIPRPLQLS